MFTNFMEMIMKHILALGFLFALAGCSMIEGFVSPTDIKSEVEVKSSPAGATVYVFSVKQNKLVELGKTPLIYGMKELIDEARMTSVKLLIAKNGYVKEHVIINNDIHSNHKIKISLENAFDWSKKNNRVTSYAIDGSWESLQKINRLIRKRKYSESLLLIDELIKDFEFAPILYDMKGSILTLQNKKSEASIAYAKAKQLREKK